MSFTRLQTWCRDLDMAQREDWLVAGILSVSVLAISSAAAVTRLMENAGPVSTAAWRLQATSLALLPGFVWDWWWLPDEKRKRVANLKIIGILAASGTALAFHFGLWIWSLLHTSLPHSLLLVSTPPIILAVVSWLRCRPLSAGENAGVGLGVLGVVVMSNAHKGSEVTFAGDFASFLSACAFVAYMLVGAKLREWMPLFLYVFPVTAGASVLLTLCCTVIDGMTNTDYAREPFGWLSQKYWTATVFLALGPGCLGHAGLNAALKYCDPLVITMAVTLEPVFGSILGWLMNVSDAPGTFTCMGGALLVGGTVWVNYAGGRSKQKRELMNASLTETITQSQEEEPLLVNNKAVKPLGF